MFLGSYTPSFNLKSKRVALPKKIRAVLSSKEIILSLGFEKCIFGFDTKAWNEESAKHLSGSLSQRNARDIRRFFFSAAAVIKFDDQGRFVIPGNLLEHAQIKRPIIIGAGDHFEIWEETNWQEHQKQLEQTE